jgi:hypothetical protein
MLDKSGIGLRRQERSTRIAGNSYWDGTEAAIIALAQDFSWTS